MRFAILPGAVWDGVSDRAMGDRAIVVNGTRIESIVSARGLTAGIRTVRFPSCTALPGLIDGHVHYSGLHGPLYLAAGVTTVRDVGVDGRLMDAAVRAAHRRGLRVTAHLGAADWRRAPEAGIDGIEHFSGCGPVWRDAARAEVAGFVSAIAGAGIAMMPAMVVWDRIGRKTDPAPRHDRRLLLLHPRWRAVWKAHASSTRLHAPETLSPLLRAVERIQDCGRGPPGKPCDEAQCGISASPEAEYQPLSSWRSGCLS